MRLPQKSGKTAAIHDEDRSRYPARVHGGKVGNGYGHILRLANPRKRPACSLHKELLFFRAQLTSFTPQHWGVSIARANVSARMNSAGP